MLSEAQTLQVLGRSVRLFEQDFEDSHSAISDALCGSSILILGAAGSIGGATVERIAGFRPKVLHLVDSNENELAEIVRKLRISEFLLSQTSFATYAIDINSSIFEQFCGDGREYDYIFNFAAMKHVRSESNVYSLLRMIHTNIITTNRIISNLFNNSNFKYFCVSTDKAANPVNLMGYTKLIMEKYAFSNVDNVKVSSARFANVAFSNGSLLQSFDRRFFSGHALVVPSSIKRFFVTEAEAGAICAISGCLAPHRSILIPSESAGLALIAFEEIVTNYLNVRGYSPHFISDGVKFDKRSLSDGAWPVIVSEVNTTGEKPFEEFSTADDKVVKGRYRHLNEIQKDPYLPEIDANEFERLYRELLSRDLIDKSDILKLLEKTGVQAHYVDLGRYLDDKL